MNKEPLISSEVFDYLRNLAIEPCTKLSAWAKPGTRRVHRLEYSTALDWECVDSTFALKKAAEWKWGLVSAHAKTSPEGSQISPNGLVHPQRTRPSALLD